MFELLTFAPGEVVIAEGVVDAHLYILQAGRLRIRKESATVATIETQGTFIGEIAAILGEPRTCTVEAETECDVLRLAATIDEIVKTNPHITKLLLAEMARRIQRSTSDLVEMRHTVITFQEHLSTHARAEAH